MYTGVDIGGTKCAVVFGDYNADGIFKIYDKVKIPTSEYKSPETALKAFTDIIKSSKYKPAAAGISCGGPLDPEKGIILSPPNLPCWDNIKITEYFENELNIPVALQNDANACAMAEWKFGAGRGCRNMVFLTFGTGFGAGLILDGKIYNGTNGMAGEIGHIRLDSFGPVGFGKSGSAEGFCSGGGIAQLGQALALEQLQCGRTVGYCKSLGELKSVTAKSIAEYAENGDETALLVYKISGKKLGYAVSLLIDLLNPEKIIIGSVFQRAENLLREEMEKVINTESLQHSRNVCRVEAAALGDDIGDFAALSVADEALRRSKA